MLGNRDEGQIDEDGNPECHATGIGFAWNANDSRDKLVVEEPPATDRHGHEPIIRLPADFVIQIAVAGPR